MDSKHIVIGTEGYTVPQIVPQISEDIRYSNSKWQKLFSLLNTEQDTREKIKSSMENPKLTTDEILLTILLEWQHRNSERATLFNLITIFRQSGFYPVADKLQNKLGHSSDSPSKLNQPECLREEQHHLLKLSKKQPPSSPSSIVMLQRDMIQRDVKLERIKLWFIFIIALLMVVLVIIIAILLIFSLLLLLREKLLVTPPYGTPISPSTAISMKPTEHAFQRLTYKEVAKTSTDSSTKQQCRQLIYAPYPEFQEKILDIQPHAPVCVHILISNCSSLPTPIGSNYRQITNAILSGCVSPALLSAILGLLPGLQNLKIRRTQALGHCLKKNTKQERIANSRKIQLNSLTSLTVENFGECPDILDSLSSDFLTPNIKTLIICNTSYVVNSISVLKSLLKMSRYSLAYLSITFETHFPPIFENMMFILSNVVHVNISLSDNLNKDFDQLGSNAHNILPNLVTLYISGGTVSWTQYLQILKLGKIQELELDITVPPGEIFSLDTLVSNLTFLRQAKLFIHFSNPKVCKIIGSRVTKTKPIYIRANCDVMYI